MKETITYSIYKVICPSTGKPVYVGMTTDKIVIRLARHITSIGRSENSKVKLMEFQLWLKRLIEKNQLPKIALIETTTDKTSAAKKERYWIAWYRKKYALFNVADGGFGVSLKNEEHPQCKVDSSEVVRIREMYATKKYTHLELADLFGVTRGYIGRIISGKRRQYVEKL